MYQAPLTIVSVAVTEDAVQSRRQERARALEKLRFSRDVLRLAVLDDNVRSADLAEDDGALEITAKTRREVKLDGRGRTCRAEVRRFRRSQDANLWGRSGSLWRRGAAGGWRRSR